MMKTKTSSKTISDLEVSPKLSPNIEVRLIGRGNKRTDGGSRRKRASPAIPLKYKYHTPSEDQLCEDEVAADYRDFFYVRKNHFRDVEAATQEVQPQISA
jgi:hypothetical protein